MPIAEVNDATSQLPSSYYVEDGSYLRLQTLQLGYELSEKLLRNISVSQFRAYVMINNVFTMTKYSGLDPAIQTSDQSFGVDLASWPTPRRYTFGINIKL